MLSTITIFIKKNLSPVPQVSCKNLTLTIFVVLSLLVAFIATTSFFICHRIQVSFAPITSIISTEYENYLQFIVILAFLTVIVVIYGCNAVNIESTKALTIYLVLKSISFITFLLYIAYLMDFIEEIQKTVGNNYVNATNYEKSYVENWLGCHGNECRDELMLAVGAYLRELIVVSSVVIGCQLLVKIIGSKVLSDLYRKERAFSISYKLNEVESPKLLPVAYQDV